MGLLEVASIERTGRDGRLVSFGPLDQMFWKLEIPSTLSRRVTYKSGLIVDLECVFSGERLEISRMELNQPKNQYISTQLLTQLGLPAVLNKIFLETSPTTKAMSSIPKKEELSKDQLGIVITQLYWFEYASWANPRMRVIQYTNWSTNNANTHFRKLAKLYGLPGAHSASKNSKSSAQKKR
jgi:hypothetical protein